MTTHELVISNGRVIDPASGLDATRHLGIDRGQITAMSSSPLTGADTIDASGLVVAPGFIDLHTHTPTQLGTYLAARGGVTTALDLEAGAYPVMAYGDSLLDGSPINYGASAGYFAMRIKVIDDKDQPYLFVDEKPMRGSKAFVVGADQDQKSRLKALLHEGLDQGGLGIGLLLDYMDKAIDPEELRLIGEVAAERHAPIFVHVRRGVAGDPSGLDEMLELAVGIGAPVHICHINASAMGALDEWLARIDAAKSKGGDVTYEMYPYTAGSTSISADVFSRNWQEIFGITPTEVQLGATGEWLTEESWQATKESDPRANIIHHYMKEEWIQKGIADPNMIVATDAMPCFNLETKSVPNGAGTHARVLGRYVRDEELLTLSDAIAKMSLYPAQRLEQLAPSFLNKGRVALGCDADLTIFDASTVTDHATYLEPYLEATGVEHLVVNGTPVIRKSEFLKDSRPGKRQLALG